VIAGPRNRVETKNRRRARLAAWVEASR